MKINKINFSIIFYLSNELELVRPVEQVLDIIHSFVFGYMHVINDVMVLILAIIVQQHDVLRYWLLNPFYHLNLRK